MQNPKRLHGGITGRNAHELRMYISLIAIAGLLSWGRFQATRLNLYTDEERTPAPKISEMGNPSSSLCLATPCQQGEPLERWNTEGRQESIIQGRRILVKRDINTAVLALCQRFPYHCQEDVAR